MLPRLTVLPFLTLCCLLSPTAYADDPEDLTSATPITAPWHVPETLGADLPPPLAAQAGLLFINFGGEDMNWCGFGNNDPKDNCSTIFQGTVLPFTGDRNKQAALVQYIRKDFSAFNIRVTDIRPADNVDYDMEMVGDWSPAPDGGFAGVAPSIDCFNGSGGEVSFTLDYTSSAGGLAKAVLQEAAHTWGLEHVDAIGDLLYPTTAGVPDPTFKDECYQIVQLNQANQPEPSGAECPSQHKQFCGVGTKQNSFQELLQIFGPHVPDLTAPTLAITAPAEGAEVTGEFDLKFTSADDQSPQILDVEIAADGPSAFATDTLHFASPADLSFPIDGLDPGAYTITITSRDEEDNQVDATVHFTVVEAPVPTTAGDESGDTGDSSGEPASTGDDDGGTPTTGEAPGDTGEPTDTGATGDPGDATTASDAGDDGDAPDTGLPGFTSDTQSTGGADGDDGCGCRQTDRRPLAALLLPLLLGLARRRR